MVVTHRGKGLLVVGLALLGIMALPASSLAVTDAGLVVQVRTDFNPEQQGAAFSGIVAKFFSGNIAQGGFSATIDWGDGTALDTTAVATTYNGCVQFMYSLSSDCGQTPNTQSNGGEVSGNHTFAKPGPYTITVTVSGYYGSGNGQFPARQHTASGQGTIPGAPGNCNILASLGFAKLQVIGNGCVSQGAQQTTDPGVPVIVNGLELDPATGVSLTLDSSTGMLTSNGGNVTLKLGSRSQHQTTFTPKPINWRVVANPGETSISEGSAGDFQVSIGGIVLGIPALSLDKIQLIQDKSNMNFTLGVPLPLGTFFGTIKATTTILSDNAGGAHFDGLDAEIGASQKPEITGITVTAPFKAFFGHLKFTLSTNTWIVSLTFSVPGAGGIAGNTTITDGVPTDIHFSASYRTPGLAIGDTGAFFQEIDGGFTHYPHFSQPKIGVKTYSGDPNTDASRTADCANINHYYAQFLSLNQALPSYCGQVGLISFDPPLEVDGNVQVSAGPVIASKSALVIDGGFRYVDSYNDGTNNVPWAFNVNGNVTMLGLPFNRTTQQVYGGSKGQNKTNFAPINNAGTHAWATIHGDGLVEAGGGFDYTLPQNTPHWLFKITGDLGVSLIPKGAAIGAPPAGATPEQYASVVQSHANSWTIIGSIIGQLCAQIPDVATGCATGGAAISNHGVAGCASFSLPGSQVLQAIANAGAYAINQIAAFGGKAGAEIAKAASELGTQADNAAKVTAQYFQDIASSTAAGAQQVGTSTGTAIVNGLNTALNYLGLARDVPARDVSPARPARTAAAGPIANMADVVNQNITIPDVNFAVGAVYYWVTHETDQLTTCSHDALLSALSASDRASVSAAGGVTGLQVRVGYSGAAPRLFVITGTTAAPDVIVMGPDHRAIRTKGPGFIKPGWIVYKDPRHKKTYVDAVAAPAGKWDFVAVPGSSKIASVQTAAGVPIATVRAGIKSAKRRHRYVIAYRVFGRGAGETVTLEEAAGTGTVVKIATLRGSRGTVTWTPSTRIGSFKRLLIAVVKRGNLQLSEQPVLAIDLKKVARPGKPKHKHKH
jgi:hypothetical protein